MSAEWKQLLAQAIDTLGQAEVARRLKLSPATISMAQGDKYPASTDNIEAKVLEIFGGKKMEAIPAGYMKDAKGRLVLMSDITPLEQQRDALAKELAAKATELSLMMEDGKKSMLAEISAHIQLAAEEYHVSIGGESGACTLLSYDGLIKVERLYSRHLAVNERAAVAKELVERYASSVASELDGETKRLVRAGLRVDEKGQLSASALLYLARRIKSSSQEWQAAVAAINDAVTTESGNPYVRISIRDDKGNYNQIPLDFSAV
jgi:hypothetical protein